MLIAQHLKLSFAERQVLNGVSLKLMPGEVLAVLGPNGAGKTTLLNCLSGDLKNYQGEIQLNATPIKQLSTEALSKLRAVMPQSVQLDFPFLVKEVIEMGIMQSVMSLEQKQILDDTLQLFDVVSLQSRNYLTLSGGEQQRVQLARVVTQVLTSPNPGVLLLDECTSNLDLAHQHQVFSVVSQLAKTHKIGVLMILHDLNLASQYADRLLLMSQGKIAFQGDAQSVLTPENIHQVYGFEVQVLKPQQSGVNWPIVMPTPGNRHPLIAGD